MQAAILRQLGLPRPYTESNPLQIETVHLAPPGPHDVRVRVAAAGLCHSDLSVIEGNRPRPMPMALGHEAAGEVLEVGTAVHDVAIGDHVVFTFVPSCGQCLPCQTGRPALCEPGAAANAAGVLLDGSTHLTDADGARVHHHLGVSAFAEQVVASRRSVVRIDRTVSFEIAALFGCAVLTGVGAIANSAQVRLGERVLVTGLGGIGLAAVLGALAAGASTVIAADVDARKREHAVTLGAHHAVDPRDASAVAAVRDLTLGGADVALECAGVVDALAFTYAATRRGGRTVTVGLPHPAHRVEVAAAQLVAEERTLQGSYLGGCVPARDIPAYLALHLTGRLPIDRLLTHTMSLAELNTGFDRLACGDAIRQVVRP